MFELKIYMSLTGQLVPVMWSHGFENRTQYNLRVQKQGIFILNHTGCSIREGFKKSVEFSTLKLGGWVRKSQ